MNKSILLAFAFAIYFTASCTRKSNDGIQYEQKEHNNQAAAKVMGQEISTSELLDGAQLEYFQIQLHEYRFKKERLDQIVRNKILSEEAKRLNISVDELMDKHILKDPITVSSSEMDRFISDKKLDKKQIDSSIQKQLEEFLKVQKREQKVNHYLAKLTGKLPVEIYFKPPVFSWPKEKIARPTKGSSKAKVQIVEVADFQCAACKKVANKMDQIYKKYGQDVAVSYLYFPGENRTDGRASAEAALCGFRQNANSFWKFHDLLMATEHTPSKNEIINLGVKSGLNKEALEKCIANQESSIDLREHFNFANKIGIRSSPVIIINGEVVAADLPIENIFTKINETLN